MTHLADLSTDHALTINPPRRANLTPNPSPRRARETTEDVPSTAGILDLAGPELSNALDRLSESVDVLGEHLTPFLRAMHPSDAETAAPDYSNESEVASRLASSIRYANTITDHVRSLTEHLNR